MIAEEHIKLTLIFYLHSFLLYSDLLGKLDLHN